MESHYEINVSFEGSHVFATAPHSARSESEAIGLLKLMQLKFPEKDGYEVSATYWAVSGTIVTRTLGYRSQLLR